MKCLGKRFAFGIVAIICITISACYLRLSGEIIVKLYSIIAGLYIAGQTITEFKKEGPK